jgi:hypothetical protein
MKELTKTKQIATRISNEEYRAFEAARRKEGDISESSFVIFLMQNFFEGGIVESPQAKLERLQAKLNVLESKIGAIA